MLLQVEERMVIVFEKEDVDNDCDSNKFGQVGELVEMVLVICIL